LVFFAASLSIYRTSILLRHFDANYGVRSLQADQSPPAKLRIRVQNPDSKYARVVLWNDKADWIFPLKSASTFKLSKAKLLDAIDEEYDDKNDNDPTRLYDQSDSADLPTLERPKWPNHEFDPHCLPAASWQTSFHPTCNEIHSNADMKQVLIDGEFSLLSRKGYWRHAWLHHKEYVSKDRSQYATHSSKTVWKTLK
jgi:hypothetical protein